MMSTTNSQVVKEKYMYILKVKCGKMLIAGLYMIVATLGLCTIVYFVLLSLYYCLYYPLQQV